MLEIHGRHNTAIVFARSLDSGAAGQLRALCDQPFAEGARLRIMPDAHAGSGSVIGTTMSITNRIVPNLVGVDIGCGMECVRLGPVRMDFRKLDALVRRAIPGGFALRRQPHRFAAEARLEELSCARAVAMPKARLAIGTLGGGNHFIELAREEESGDLWLIIHSGSRQAGLQVATHHQKAAGQARPPEVPYELAWLEGAGFEAYVHDMKIMQEYAGLNRQAIADEILKGMKWKALDRFSTAHNYLDTEQMILRKGAVSAQKGERLLIPMNMRDGSLLCEGLGNADWNFSAPHGAGRALSRSEAKGSITLTSFRQAMEGVYSSCISRQTIDESPAAYKPMQDILDQIGPTVRVISRLKPLYNFKAGGE